MGLTSEHFKLAGQLLVQFLTDLLNHLIQTKSGMGCPERRDCHTHIQAGRSDTSRELQRDNSHSRPPESPRAYPEYQT